MAAQNADGDGEAAHQDMICLQLIEAHAKAARLDTCLRAVAAETSRTALITSDIKNATLPLLLNLEMRLTQLLKKTATQVSRPET